MTINKNSGTLLAHIASIKEFIQKIRAAISPNSQMAIEVSRIVDRIRGEEQHNFTPNLKFLFKLSQEKPNDSDTVKAKKKQLLDVLSRMKPYLQDFVNDMNDIYKTVTDAKAVSEPKQPYCVKKPGSLAELGQVLSQSMTSIEKDFNRLSTAFESSRLDENVNDPAVKLVGNTIKDAVKDIGPLKQGVDNINYVIKS